MENHFNSSNSSAFESLFERVWDISVDGMRLVNSSGIIININPAYSRMIGIPAEFLTGKLFTEVYHPTIREETLKNFRLQIRQRKLKTHNDFERILHNGKRIWFEISNSFIELENETFILSLIRNITQRKDTDSALLRSESRFRLLFNSANDAVFVNQLNDDHKPGPFLEVNEQTVQRLLYSHEEFKNLNPYAIIPQKYYSKLDEAIADLVKNKHTIYEIEHLRKDKRRIPVEISAHLFEYKNRPTILSIARDITERKRSEITLRETSTQLRNLASRLQTIREEERSMIAREIHDELGQVLTVLKIQISLLANNIPNENNAMNQKLNDLAGLIDQSVESVQRITAKLRPGILDELGLVATIEWQANDFEKITGIQCKCSLPDEEIELDADRSTALFRIFQEALTNVARHAEAGRVSVFLKKNNGLLILEITDNGHGISKSQIDSPQSLGLLGMKERALVFGGSVSINGLTDKGTNVKVIMPLE